MPPKDLDPGDDDRGTPDHRVERLESLLLADPLRAFDQELKVGLYRPEIDVPQGYVVAGAGVGRLA